MGTVIALPQLSCRQTRPCDGGSLGQNSDLSGIVGSRYRSLPATRRITAAPPYGIVGRGFKYLLVALSAASVHRLFDIACKTVLVLRTGKKQIR